MNSKVYLWLPEEVAWIFFWRPSNTNPRPASDPSHFLISDTFYTTHGHPSDHDHKPVTNWFKENQVSQNKTCQNTRVAVADPGSRPLPPLYFKTKLSPEGPKKFFGTPAPLPPALLYLRVWMTAPHPLSQSLDPALSCQWRSFTYKLHFLSEINWTTSSFFKGLCRCWLWHTLFSEQKKRVEDHIGQCESSFRLESLKVHTFSSKRLSCYFQLAWFIWKVTEVTCCFLL